MSIYKLIDRLGLVVEESPSLPWTSYKLVNIEKFYDQLELVMSKLPQEIKEATSIINQKDEIISQAQAKSEKMLKESQRQSDELMENTQYKVDRMVKDSEILKKIEQEAEKIKRSILQEAEEIRMRALKESEDMRKKAYDEVEGVKAGADKYAESVLASLEEDLSEALSIIRNGQKHLTTKQDANRFPPPAHSNGREKETLAAYNSEV
jgi:cell division septum initiation protein DivIVA